MTTHNTQNFPEDYVWAPGTVALKDRGATSINLFPVPTSDPDDPLNWSRWRKFVNYGIVCSFILWTFVQLDIGYTAWGPMETELGYDDWLLNQGAASNYAALAVGCIFFMPFVHKYGRRPIYIFSCAIQFAGCVWSAQQFTSGDVFGSNILTGLGGAICETVVQISIADIFFVHQHATMNGWYLLITSVGAFLGPVASGYVADSQGWRWMWWYCVIFVGIQLLATIFLYEESKFVPKPGAIQVPSRVSDDGVKNPTTDLMSVESRPAGNITKVDVDDSLPKKTYWQRMALITPTEAPVLRHVYQPFIILFTFPAISYTAFTFGTVLSCFAVVTTVQAIYLPAPPYNFSPSGVGLMNLPPFIGTFFGFFVAGWLNDKSIVWLANRNKGIYEPEQRLWMAIPASIFVPAGILIFGIGIANGVHWIVLAIGTVLFGFGFIVCLDIALAYCTDCYQDIVGDALVGVVFTRNVVSVVILFVLQYWINGMGVQNMHILIACLMLAILLLPAVLLKYGKQARIWTQTRYRNMALKQPTQRTFH